jgi:hypothetical protein
MIPEAKRTMDFPHPTLTRIHGKPTPQALIQLEEELFTNAISIPSTRGGGQHGHLALVMAADEYTTIAAAPFAAPVHPGQPPVHAANSSNAQIHAADTAYERELAEFATYHTTKNALLALILAAVEPNYYNILKVPRLGYATVTPLAVLQHLKTTYGTITAQDLRDNRTLLSAPWDPADDITALWTRAAKCQGFARDTNEPLHDDTLMVLLLDALQASGVMTQYINEWNRRDTAEQTFANFKTHFNRANKVRLMETTVQQAGYHHANTATVPNHPESILPPPLTVAATTTTTTMPTVSAEKITLHYCWTHGLGRNANHTSQTCKNPAPGHQPDATFLNTKGGALTFQNEPSWRKYTRKTN